jgi:flavin-dependent dehydrogenase
VMPRTVLDERLVRSATDAGAVLRRHRVRDLVVGEDEVVLDGEIRARVVVGADGAGSVVRTALGQPPSRRRAVAIRGYAPTPPRWRGRQMIVFGERRHPSYAWAFDRGDGLSNVGYGELVTGDRPTRASLLADLEELLPGTTSTTTGWRAHLLPLSGRRPQRSSGRVLLVGDAAHLVNPLTGEGIFYAVSTGIAAGRATSRALERGRPDAAGDHLDRAVRRLLSRHLRHTWTAAGLNRSTAVLDAGLVAASRDQRAFDALIELGLGRGLITPRLAYGLAGGLRARLGTSPTAPSRTEATR